MHWTKTIMTAHMMAATTKAVVKGPSSSVGRSSTAVAWCGFVDADMHFPSVCMQLMPANIPMQTTIRQSTAHATRKNTSRYTVDGRDTCS